MSHRNPIREVKKYVPPGVSAPPVPQPAAEVQQVKKFALTPAEALVMAKRIRSSLNTAGESLAQADRDLLEFKERKGWKGLGYKTWTECAEAEFGVSVRHVDRRIAAARTRLALEDETVQTVQTRPAGLFGHEGPISNPIPDQESETGTVVPVSEVSDRTLRPLDGLPPEEARKAFHEAVAASPDGKPTAKAVQAAADRRKPVQVIARLVPPEVTLALPAPDPDTPRIPWKEIVALGVAAKKGVILDLTESETLDLNRLIKGEL